MSVTVEQLLQGLEAADKAGDTEAASIFAQKIQEYSELYSPATSAPDYGQGPGVPPPQSHRPQKIVHGGRTSIDDPYSLEAIGGSVTQGMRDLDAGWESLKAAANVKRAKERARQGDVEGARRHQEALIKQLPELARINKERAEGYNNPAVANVGKATTFEEAWEGVKTSPMEVLTHGVARNLPQMAAAVIAAFTASPIVGAAIAAGTVGGINEFGNSFLEFASDQGVNITDPAALEAFFADKETVNAAIKFSATRAGIITAVDAATGALLPVTLVPKAMKGPAVRGVTNVVTHTAAGGGIGATGEVLAQKATGQWKPGETMMELVVGGGTSGASSTAVTMIKGTPSPDGPDLPDAGPLPRPAEASDILARAREVADRERAAREAQEAAPEAPAATQATTPPTQAPTAPVASPMAPTGVPDAPGRSIDDVNAELSSISDEPDAVPAKYTKPARPINEQGQLELSFEDPVVPKPAPTPKPRHIPMKSAEVGAGGQMNLFSKPNIERTDAVNEIQDIADTQMYGREQIVQRDAEAQAKSMFRGREQIVQDMDQEQAQSMFRGRDQIRQGMAAEQAASMFRGRDRMDLGPTPAADVTGVVHPQKALTNAKMAAKAALLTKADALTGNAEDKPVPPPEHQAGVLTDKTGEPSSKVPLKTEKATEQTIKTTKLIRMLVEEAVKKNPRTAALEVYKELSKLLGNAPAHKLINDRIVAVLQLLVDRGLAARIQILTPDIAVQLGYPDSARGQYNPHDGKSVSPGFTITLKDSLTEDGNVSTNHGVMLSTLLHEGVHAATHHMIILIDEGKITDPKLIAAVKALKDIGLQAGIGLGIEGGANAERAPVWTQNADEVLAHGLTSPAFTRWLSITPDINNKARSLLTKFRKAILTLLGIEEGADVQLYERVLEAFDDITSAVPNSINEIYTLFNDYYSWTNKSDQLYDAVDNLDPQTLRGLRMQVEGEYFGFSATSDTLSPYGAFNDLTDSVIAPEGVTFTGMDEEGLFSPNPIPINNEKDAPYVLINHPTVQGRHIVVNVGNSGVFLAIQRRFPQANILTPAQGQHFLQTGQLPHQTLAAAQARANAQNALQTVGRVIDAKGMGLLEHFMDIHNAQEAKQLQLQEGDLAPGSNLTDYVVSGVNAKAIITKSPLLRFVRGLVQTIVRAQAMMARQHVMPMGNIWFKMDKAEKEVFVGLALLQDRQQRDFTAAELAQFGASPAVVSMLQKMRVALDESLDHWNAQRQAVNLPEIPRRGGYFPYIFEGDYRAVARDDQGAIIGVVTAGSNLSLKNKKATIANKYPGTTFDATIRISMERKNKGGMNMWDQHDAVARFLQQSPNTSAAAQEFATFLNGLAVEDAQHLLGFSVHGKYKKGVFGAKGNDPTKSAEDNAAESFQSLVTYLEDGAQHHAMLPVLDDMSKLITDPELRLNAPRTLQYMESLYQHLSRRKSPSGDEGSKDFIGKGLKGIGRGIDTTLDAVLDVVGIGPTAFKKEESRLRAMFSTWVMGLGNIAFTGLQFLQVPAFASQAASYLRGATGLGVSSVRGRAATLKATLAVSRLFIDQMGTKFGNGPMQGANWFAGDPKTHRALQYALDNNLITLNDLELAHTATMSPGWRMADAAANFNQRAAEATTRPFVFMWYHYILRDTNLPEQDQLEIARNATNFTMAEYHATARPMIYNAMGTTGQLTGQLKTFAHSAAGQSYFWTKMGGKGKGMRPFATMLTGYLLIMGMNNVPLGDELDWLSRWASKKALGNEYSLKTAMQVYAPEWVSIGVASSLTGIDFQTRLRMPPLVQDTLIANAPSANWASQVGAAILEAMIKTKSEVKEGRGLVSPYAQVEREKAGYMMAPSSLKGPLETILYREYGTDAYLTRDKTERYDHRGTFDWELRKWGLRSLHDTKVTEGWRKGLLMTKELQERKTALASGIATTMAQYGQVPKEDYDRAYAEYVYDLGGDRKQFEAAIKAAMEKKGIPRNRPTGPNAERTWLFQQPHTRLPPSR